MQILKPLLIVCVAVCTLSVRGADNAKQAKAREALQKLQGVTNQPVQTPPLQAQPEQAAPPTPAPPPATQPPASVPPPEATPLPQRTLPTPAPPPAAVEPPVQAAPAEAAPADSDAIARAREAMRLKMQEVVSHEPPPPAPAPAPAPSAAPAPAPVTPAPTPTVTQAPPPTPQPEPPPPTPAPPPPPLVTAPAVQSPVQPALPNAEEADPAAIAKAREALRLKMQQLQAEQPERRPVAPPPAPVVSQSPPLAAPVTPQPLPPALATTQAAPPPLANPETEVGADPATIEKAREAVRMKMQTLPVPVDETKAGQTAGYLHRPERVTGPGNFPPLAGPVSPISAAKQQQLDALLLSYKADQITPEQYHAERAKILGEQ
ncbi:MAG TPA: hypothetical protein VNZ64_10735 [Candidatus Acidoferrum sp.]|jgi:hypothetical protein|nr:hypothetical protein [Candidatus Acidoferrum sp.]